MTRIESEKRESTGTAVKDSGWDKYFIWPWDYFPIKLPGCVIEMKQTGLNQSDSGVISWTMDKGLPLIARVDDAVGTVMAELLPEPKSADEAAAVRPPSTFCVNHELSAALLSGTIGLGFTWVFYVPIVPYVPKHPLGIVKVAGAELLGKQTSINIRDIRPPK